MSDDDFLPQVHSQQSSQSWRICQRHRPVSLLPMEVPSLIWLLTCTPKPYCPLTLLALCESLHEAPS